MIIVGDFNIPLTSMDRQSSQKINKDKETLDLNDTLDQIYIYIYMYINIHIYIHTIYI